MADLNVALILKLVDRATGPARAAMRSLERMGGEGLVRQAQRAQQASAMIAGGVGSIAGAATRGGLAVAAYGAGITALAASFVRPAAQFEQFNVQLTALEGSSEKAATAMAWIEDFATRTPLELEDTVAAYAKLKAFGLDPTEGSLQALVDTMAASGGGAEQLNGLVLALGQSWTKGKLQGEEAMQMLERGVPVWDLLSAKMGKTNAELIEMASAGELGREEILLLVEALAEQNAGASEAMSKTWGGITSNLRDHWTRFQRMVMASGLFDWMKGQLEDLLDTLNTMTANGELQAWAESVGAAIRDGLIGLMSFGRGVYDMLDRIQTALGGWDILGWTALMVLFAKPLFAVAAGFRAIGAGLLLLSANPLFWLAAAAVLVALSVYAIYQNWGDVVGFFTDKIDRIKAAFDVGLLQGVGQIIKEFNPVRLLGEVLVGVPLLILKTFDIDLYNSAVQMMDKFYRGIKDKMEDISAFVAERMGGMFPGYVAGVTHHIDATGALVDGPAERGLRALGGPVRAGSIYQWQEEGRELFVPSVDGTVISNRQLRAMRGGGGRAAPSFTIGAIHITAAAGQSARDVALAVRRELEDMARTAPLHDGGAYGD
jgi:tape measure domain-containing protein